MPRGKAKSGRRRTKAGAKRVSSVNQIIKIAQQVATNTVIKLADPNFVVQTIGADDNVFDTDGQYDTTKLCPLSPGNGASVNDQKGYGVAFPKVELATDIDKIGKPHYRKDLEILVNAIAIKGMYILPPNVDYAYITMFFGTAKNAIDLRDFTCPDGVDNVRFRRPGDSKYRKVYYQNTIKITHHNPQIPSISGSAASTDMEVRKFDFFRKFPKPIKITYTSPTDTSWQARRFFVAWKASYQDNTSAFNDDLKMIGRVVTYYRDN